MIPDDTTIPIKNLKSQNYSHKEQTKTRFIDFIYRAALFLASTDFVSLGTRARNKSPARSITRGPGRIRWKLQGDHCDERFLRAFCSSTTRETPDDSSGSGIRISIKRFDAPSQSRRRLRRKATGSGACMNIRMHRIEKRAPLEKRSARAVKYARNK